MRMVRIVRTAAAPRIFSEPSEPPASPGRRRTKYSPVHVHVLDYMYVATRSTTRVRTVP